MASKKAKNEFRNIGKVEFTRIPRIMVEPFVCPVCGGNGLVANGFYTQTSGIWQSSGTDPETCRSCDGTGIVWG